MILIASSVPATSTINWLAHTTNPSWEAFFHNFTLYPLFLALAIGVRFLIANPLLDPFIQRVIVPRFSGLKKALSITLINVLIMGTLVALFRTLMMTGDPTDVSWVSFVSSLPLSFLISFVFSYFIASPLTKKLYAKALETRIERAFNRIERKLHALEQRNSLQDRLALWMNDLGSSFIAQQRVNLHLQPRIA